MNMMTLFLFIAGFVALVGGAEWLVRGASRLAVAIGVAPLVIGLTVVAFGTSAPELAVSVRSALNGQPDLALGNVVGSNILNILVILGMSAVIIPLAVSQQLIRLDVPLMIGASVLVYVMALDGAVGRWEGALLFVGAIGYTVFSIVKSRRESAEIETEYAEAFNSKAPGRTRSAVLRNLGMMALGLILLIIGARWLVDGAVAVARFFGVSELIIALTIVSIGTSLPEVAASVMAALRGERDIAVGNAVGSNLFNLFSVLGLTSLISPTGVAVSPAALNFDIPVMIAVAVACLPIFFTEHRIDRWEGVLFLVFYLAYVAYLILNATAHPALGPFSAAMLWFALPLTGMTLLVLVVRALRQRRSLR
jgi:cation:H+ antiporter